MPAPAAGHPGAVDRVADLARRARARARPDRDPETFSWPGPWLAVLRSSARAGRCARSRSGRRRRSPGTRSAGRRRSRTSRAGYAVAPADVALWTRRERAVARTAGRVEAIAIAAAAEAPIELVERGDRARRPRARRRPLPRGPRHVLQPALNGHELTLVEAEVLDELGSPPRPTRRNVVTRGIDLNALVGQRFTVGDVECVGRRLCEPCAHSSALPGTLRPLVHRGGLRADCSATARSASATRSARSPLPEELAQTWRDARPRRARGALGRRDRQGAHRPLGRGRRLGRLAFFAAFTTRRHADAPTRFAVGDDQLTTQSTAPGRGRDRRLAAVALPRLPGHRPRAGRRHASCSLTSVRSRLVIVRKLTSARMQPRKM